MPGAASAAAGGSGASASAPAADGGLAGALASALAARKAKVSHSGMYTLLLFLYFDKKYFNMHMKMKLFRCRCYVFADVFGR